MELRFNGTVSDWRRAARAALRAECAPAVAHWIDATAEQDEFQLLVAEEPPDAPTTAPTRDAEELAERAAPEASRESIPARRVPRAFVALVDEVSCHRDATRWALLYRLLWRLTHDEPHLLEDALDPDVQTAHALAKAVRRDLHKMRAFVRFREVASDHGPWFVAWFEPQHHIVEANAPFFRDRFASMCWSILTPERCAHWDRQQLRFSAGVPASAAPRDDKVESLWRTYYANIFNPARLKISAMTSEMPQHYWKNLPEAALIPSLVAAARTRTDAMVTESAAAVAGGNVFARPEVPRGVSVETLRGAAASCRACPLWRTATCTVFGEGPSAARIVVVGEQPGDQEDRQGRPFVGPAGQLLNRALAAAGINREQLYLTNAVKHFKWEPRGKRRLHQRPNAREVAACRPWLEAELHALRPERIVCLGATAANAITGRTVRVMAERGQYVSTEFGAPALITIHPSALLRLAEGLDPEAEFQRFVADLRLMAAPLS